MQFKNILKDLRKERDLTQKEVATATQLSATCINQLEAGTRNPTGSTLMALAEYFECSIDYLMGRETNLEDSIFKTSTEKKLIKRPDATLAENFIKEFSEILQDKHFLDFSKLYKYGMDEITRVFVVSMAVGYLKKAGVNTESIVGY